MPSKTRITTLALALLFLGCGGGDGRPAHDSGGPDGVDGSAPSDVDTSDVGVVVPDVPAVHDGSEDRAVDAPTGSDAADADAPSGFDTQGGGAFDLASEAVPADSKPPVDAGCTLLDDVPATLPAISFSEYHGLSQMLNYLQAVAVAVPRLAQYKVLGISKQGRDIGALVVNATCQSQPPAIFFNGAHHGDEAVSAEAVLGLVDHLLRQGANDSAVRGLLRSYSFTFLPVVNPDGLAANTRLNADGVDINRDYPFPGRSEADAFKTGEARVVKALQEDAGFAGAVAFHSGAEEVLWPWCYTATGTDDEAFFLAAGKKTAAAMSFTIYQQSYDDYPTQGEYIDYAYAKSRTLAATFEVSVTKQPSSAALAGVVMAARQGAMAWTQAVSDHAQGRRHALPSGPRLRFPLTTPFDGRGRLE